ncbi:MAG: hypothetical protein JST28_18240 [Acidobacteria bacterium]|nr:hypothetical protein [Acidobacteriota bacterium]
MPTQPVFELRSSHGKPARVSLKSAKTFGKVVSICDSPAFSRVIEHDAAEPVRDGLGCARAIRAAFFLEGSMGAAVYALWHFRHALSAIHLIH